jgi:SPW repeat
MIAQTTWWRREAPLDLYTLACGLYLLAAPWLFGFVRPLGRLDAELIGSAIVALSIAAIFVFAEWEEWLKVLLGVWLIAAPWVLGFAHTSAMHVSIAVGAVVTFLALLELWVVHDDRFA